MQEESIVNTQKTDEISLGDFIQKIKSGYLYLLTKWILIATFGILGGVLGFTYAWFKKPVYKAVTTFVLEDTENGGGLGQYAGLASMIGIDVGGGGGIFQGDNILELYRSRTMIKKTLLTTVDYNGKSQLLVDRYIDFNKLREKWLKRPGLSGLHFTEADPKNGLSTLKFSRLQDSVLGKIVDDIETHYLDVSKPDKKLSIIMTVVTSPDEFFSKTFNEQIVKNVNDFYVQTKTKKSLYNVNILQQKTDSVRSVMNGAIYSGASIADATPNLNPTRQVQRIVPMQRSQFSAETNKGILEELVKNLEMSKIALRKETPLIQIIDSPVFPLEKTSASKIVFMIIGGFISTILIVIFFISKKIIGDINDR